MATDRYQTPLAERYASKEMQYIFSPDKKFSTWRKLWIALAESACTFSHFGFPKCTFSIILYSNRAFLRARIMNINVRILNISGFVGNCSTLPAKQSQTTHK